MQVNSAEPSTSSSDGPSVRIPVDVRRFPWIRRLAADYAYDFRSVAPFFSGDPADRAAWADAIARTQAHDAPARRDRRGHRGAAGSAAAAPARAREAGALLADRRTVAIVTGQQAGLFGGPLFTLLKALTALKLAEQVVARAPRAGRRRLLDRRRRSRLGRSPVVYGVRRAARRRAPSSLPARPGADPAPVATVTPRRLDRRRPSTSSNASCRRPNSAPALIAELRARLRAGRRHGRRVRRAGSSACSASAGWSSTTRRIRRRSRSSASVFARELSTPGQTVKLAALGRRGSDRRAATTRRSTRRTTASRCSTSTAAAAPIRQQDGQLRRRRPAASRPAALVQQADDRPAGFSPNVLLRPIVQDTLFPTICYVAGPERARLSRPAARRLRALRRADAADVSARVGDAARFRGAALPHEVSSCRSKRCRRRTKRR